MDNVSKTIGRVLLAFLVLAVVAVVVRSMVGQPANHRTIASSSNSSVGPSVDNTPEGVLREVERLLEKGYSSTAKQYATEESKAKEYGGVTTPRITGTIEELYGCLKLSGMVHVEIRYDKAAPSGDTCRIPIDHIVDNDVSVTRRHLYNVVMVSENGQWKIDGLEH